MNKTQLNVYIPVDVRDMLLAICADLGQKPPVVIANMIRRRYRALERRMAAESEAPGEQKEAETIEV